MYIGGSSTQIPLNMSDCKADQMQIVVLNFRNGIASKKRKKIYKTKKKS